MTKEVRTWEEFTEEMVERGRTQRHIKAVCLGTRWHCNCMEILALAKKLKKFFKKSKKNLRLKR